MATASITSASRIRTNIPAMNAYNTLSTANRNIANHQLRLSTGKRINSAADDVAGYITSRALSSRNSALASASTAVGQAMNVTSIVQDSLDNINTLMNDIKTATASASSGALGEDEKVALAKSAYRLAEQIQTVVDSTVFGGKQLIDGTFTGDWTVGYKGDNTLLEIEVDLLKDNADYDLAGAASDSFDLNATAAGNTTFAGVAGLDLTKLADDDVVTGASGLFNEDNINTTMSSMSAAIGNINKVASYVGGIENRLNSQEELLTSQTTNYKAAISRIEDADVATEQMKLIQAQFLQQSSLISLAQANQNPQSFLQLFS